MKATDKPGFFKSLFGGGRQVERRPPLPLYLPITVAKIEKGGLPNVEAIWNQVSERQPGPLLLLQEVNRYLDRINPLPLPSEQRMRLSNIVLKDTSTAITTLFTRFFQQGGGIPETREQREGISHAVRAAEQLAISYKLLFRQDWGGEPGVDPEADERLTAVGLRIMACIRLEQLLRAFRYQKLPQFAWRDANQLFFALRGGWDVKAGFALKLRFTVEDMTSRLELFPASASIEQLYLDLQLTGLLDVISWPVHLMYRVSDYLHELKEGAQIIGDDRGDALSPGQIVVYRNRGAPPSFDRSHEQLGEALLIDLSALIRRVSEEQAVYNAAPDAPSANAILKVMLPGDRSQFMELLLRRLQPQRRQDPRQRVFDVHQARVYGGFETVYRLFREIAAGEAQPGASSRDPRFWDRLPQDAPAADDGERLAESRWLVTDESPGGLQLRQQESAYGMPLHVGRLVAYCTGEQGLVDARLGYLVRMQRRGEDEVEVAIARLQGRISAAMVEDLDALDHRSLPALLIHDADGKLRLLCDNKHNFITGERLAIISDDHHYTGALGEVVLGKGDFTVFELYTAQ